MVERKEFSVRVKKAEVVAAALPIQELRLRQSNLDLLLPPLNFGVFFCYKQTKPKFTFDVVSSILKAALAESLVCYYALAGEVVQNAAGEPELLCNNRGVDFVEAFADIELKEVNFYNPDESMEKKLVPTKKHGVLAVQVTELKCGGVVVACTFDHRIADAYSANMFLVSWSEIAKAKPLSLFPCFRRSLLFPRRPGHYDLSVDAMYTLFSSLPMLPESLNPEQIAVSRIYYIESNQIIFLQSLANSDKNIVKFHQITKLEAFSAFLWKTIATGEQHKNVNSRLGIVVQGRKILCEKETKSMKGYFGNVLSLPFGERAVRDLTEKPLNWVANVVHQFLEEAVTREHFLGLIDWVEAHRPEPAVARIYGRHDGPAVVVSSGRQFPVREIDFGFGKAVFGSYHFPWGGQTGYVMPMPSPKGNGDWIVYMHLMKGQLEVIEAHAPHVLKPMSSKYLDLY